VNTFAAALCVAQIGCAASNATTSSQISRALKTEQTENHIAIGRKDNAHLEYIDMTADGALSRASFSAQQESPVTSIDLSRSDELQSSDQIWKADCPARKAECTISEAGNPNRKFSVLRKGLLTPIYWSPDGKFIFYIRQAPRWRFPPRCSFEDERDVMVRDLTEESEGVVSTTCGGYPYGSLRWYRLPTLTR
jgi:hypothetical protein